MIMALRSWGVRGAYSWSWCQGTSRSRTGWICIWTESWALGSQECASWRLGEAASRAAYPFNMWSWRPLT